jgi:CubicO group peptidase (beta-lactamase class C family)
VIDELELRARVEPVLNRWPAVGLAVGVVRAGRLQFFHGHGVADIGSNRPITEETVFRIGSITKIFTAIAVMQLYEQGLVDLDAPANEYLRAYRLVPAHRGFRPPTVRHLLTHTSGIPEVVHVSDLLHPCWGPIGARPAALSVPTGEPLPSLADYYRGRLRVVVEPGTAFAYTNHGFATLGQIVEDVTGTSLERYFHEHIFAPLGMADTGLARSQIAARHATGYVLGRRGAKAIADRDWIGAGAGGLYSTPADLAGFIAAIAGGGANDHGSVLRPAALASMFDAHYRPDPRLPGMGLGFFRSEAGGRRVVGHDGLLPGFVSAFFVAPDDGVGVIGLTNGSSGAFVWLPTELGRLLRHLLDVPDDVVRRDVPHHPEIWGEICGRYRLPERIADLRGRMMMGGGAEVFVRRGRLMVRVLSPVPALYRGFPLHPDDVEDPYAFRLDLSELGMESVRVVFERRPGIGTTAVHTDLQSLSLNKRLTRRLST